MTSWKAKNASREELRKRIAELEECNQRLEEDLEESMQRITTLKEQSVLQKDDLSEARIRIQSLEEELRCSAERIEQQTRDMTLLQEKIPKLESSLDYVTQQFQSEREEYRNKEKRMDRLQENVKHLEKEILRLESEKAQLLMFTASRSNSTPVTPKIGGHLRSTVVAGTTQGNKERETEVIQKLKRQHQVEIVARDTHMALVVQQLEAKVARYAEALRSIGSQDALNHVDKKCEIHTHVCEEEMCTLIQERDQLLAMNDELEKRNESVWHQLQDAHETVHTLMILVSTLGCKPFDLEAVEKDDSTYEPISTTTSSVSENSFRSWLDINSNALMLDIHKLMLSQGAKSKGSLQVMV